MPGVRIGSNTKAELSSIAWPQFVGPALRRSSLQLPQHAAQPRFYCRGGTHTGAGDRRPLDDVWHSGTFCSIVWCLSLTTASPGKPVRAGVVGHLAVWAKVLGEAVRSNPTTYQEQAWQPCEDPSRAIECGDATLGLVDRKWRGLDSQGSTIVQTRAIVSDADDKARA